MHSRSLRSNIRWGLQSIPGGCWLPLQRRGFKLEGDSNSGKGFIGGHTVSTEESGVESHLGSICGENKPRDQLLWIYEIHGHTIVLPPRIWKPNSTRASPGIDVKSVLLFSTRMRKAENTGLFSTHELSICGLKLQSIFAQ